MSGELFVEYQLAAKAERPDLFVAMAAYGDYGPGYIGTAIAYQQGGYEVTEYASSNVTPEVEGVLMAAIKKLLQPTVRPSIFHKRIFSNCQSFLTSMFEMNTINS